MVGGNICTLCTKLGASRDNDLTEGTRENLPPQGGADGILVYIDFGFGYSRKKKKSGLRISDYNLYLSKFGL